MSFEYYSIEYDHLYDKKEKFRKFGFSEVCFFFGHLPQF